MRVLSQMKDALMPWGFVGSYIVFPVKMALRRMGIGAKYYKDIAVVKGSAKADRCFIVATGPSLTKEDVMLLKGEVTFGINSVFKLYGETQWIPTYYVLLDPNLTKDIIENNDLDFDALAREKCFFNSLCRKQIRCSKGLFVDMNWLDHVYHFGQSKRFRYNEELQYGLYDCYSVTQACILIAMYMGFNEIYIIGADNNYLGKRQHFTSYGGESKLSDEMAKKSQRSNDLGYKFVKSVADSKGVKVFNATRGGCVKCFPRVKLESVLESIGPSNQG